jgi:hypothetical protein
MTPRIPGTVLVLFAALLLASCGGGSSGGISGKKTADALVLVDVSVAGFDGVALNEIIVIEFSEVLDPDTVRPDTIQIREGPNYGKQVAGFFRVDGNLVEFYPRMPVCADLSDCGLQPGHAYQMRIPGRPKVATVRSFANDRMRREAQVNFQTALTGTPNLFTDNFLDPLPPKVLFVNPPDGARDVPADSEITLTFNRRPLHPATVTSSNISLTMIERNEEALNRPIQGVPRLQQTHDSVTIVYDPTFPLADDAVFRLEVDRRVQDLTGNDVTPFVSTFHIRDEPFRFDEFELTFNDTEKTAYMDPDASTASWNEAVEDGLAALFTVAGGNGTAGDLTPNSNRNYTPDDFNRGVEVITEDGVEYDVYNFRTIEIPANVSVRFSQRPGGPNRPIKLLSLKNIKIDGTLTVSGGRGEDGEQNSSNSAIPKAAGGLCGPGGGDGADNYTGSASGSTFNNNHIHHGEDVLYGGEGGKGAGMATGTTYYSWSGGGGGGGSRLAGKDGKRGPPNYTSSYPSVGGKGGKSATGRGYPVNLEREPNVGGAGAGAGGKGFYYYYPWNNGAASGGGGGGGLTIQGAGKVEIGSTGRVLADGGDGGNIVLQYYYGGAGGGGGGGSVKIRATSTIDFSAGAQISVKGGKGGQYMATYTYYVGGQGGDGGHGYIRLEAVENVNNPGKPVINGMQNASFSYGPVSEGVFAPKGGGAPSVGQTVWANLGVFDPVMIKPIVGDRIATLFNDQMTIEIQMAIEDPNNLGNAKLDALDVTDSNGNGMYDDSLDTSELSQWTRIEDIEDLNGLHYQFFRLRITFQLDPNQTVEQPLPFLDFMRVRFKF